jgi:hypothetical protein
VDESVFETLKQLHLDTALQYYKHINKNELPTHMVNCSVLLVLINNPDEDITYNNKGRIPAKLFECIGTQQPILVIGPTNGDVAHIVTETQTGTTHFYDDIMGIKNTLQHWFIKWQQQQPITSPIGTEEYTFSNLTQKMVGVLNRVSEKKQL